MPDPLPPVREEILEPLRRVLRWLASLRDAQGRIFCPEHKVEHTGKSAYAHHGERVVMGQRLMQPASDIFLGWVTGPKGRQFYVRQLRDGKIKPVIESFDQPMLMAYGVACGRVLARAHAKTSEVSATISGYLGGSSDEFDEAMGDFSVAYADQTEKDHAAFKAAVRRGDIEVYQEA